MRGEFYVAVTSLSREREPLVGCIELHAGFNKPSDRTWTSFNDLLHDLRVTETGSGIECVSNVGIEAIIVGHDRGDTPLSIGGITLAKLNLT